MTFKEFVYGSDDFPNLKACLADAEISEHYSPSSGDWKHCSVECPDAESGYRKMADHLESYIGIESNILTKSRPYVCQLEVLKGWMPKFTKVRETGFLDATFSCVERKSEGNVEPERFEKLQKLLAKFEAEDQLVETV